MLPARGKFAMILARTAGFCVKTGPGAGLATGENAPVPARLRPAHRTAAPPEFCP
jgi:hypothetical protein